MWARRPKTRRSTARAHRNTHNSGSGSIMARCGRLASRARFDPRRRPMLGFLRSLIGPKPDPGSGGLSEQLAAEWLQRERRFGLIVRNWRSPKDRRDEIDLVCHDGD